MNIYFVDRFGTASVITHQLSSGKKSSFSFPFFLPPVGGGGGGRGGKEKLNFFVRYLKSNWHFLQSPYQIYQCYLFYLLIIVKINCIKFFYCTLSVALQLHDWMNRCVWVRFIQSEKSRVKEIIE